MDTDSSNRGWPDFEDTLRTWGRRPGRVTAGQARQRVLGRLPAEREQAPFWRLTAAAAFITVLFVAGWLGTGRQTLSPFLHRSDRVAFQAQNNVVVFKLDATTTLYFVMRPDNKESGGVS